MPNKNPPICAHTATPPVTFIPMLLIPARNCKTYHRPRKTTAGMGEGKKNTSGRDRARGEGKKKTPPKPGRAPHPPTAGGGGGEVKKKGSKPAPHPPDQE